MIKGTNLVEALTFAPKISTLYGVNNMEDFASTVVKEETDALYYPINFYNNFNEGDFVEAASILLAKGNPYKNQTAAINKVVNFYKNQAYKYGENKYKQLYVALMSDIRFIVGAVREAKFKAFNNMITYFYTNDFHIPGYGNYVNISYTGSIHCQEGKSI